jgi:predicted DNA-binding transcriptional regulator YafY
MRYRRWAAPQEVVRQVEPYGLVLKSGVWYLVAGVVGAAGAAAPEGAAGAVRTYRVSQVLDVQAEGGCFERPAGFDLAAHWEAYLAEYDARRLRLHAVLRLRQELVARLPDLVDAAVVRAVAESAAGAAAGDADAKGSGADGWVTVTVPVESVALAVPMVLAWGADAVVLGPPELRQAMVLAVRNLAERYS